MGKLVLTDEEKVISARAADLIQRSEKENIPVFSEFLSDRERNVVLEKVNEFGISDRVLFWGGFEDSERVLAGFFPEYSIYMDKEELLREFPIEALKIECSGFRTHTHRDFLGSILGLGLERSVIGDIVVGDKGYEAVCFVHKRMSEYISDNLTLVGRDGVKMSVCSADSVSVSVKYEESSGTVASFRIDALLSEILNISRDKAVKLVESEFVAINHSTVTEKSKEVSQGDIMTVRGFGKFKLSEIGDVNRKGRTRFTVLKYV